VCPGATNACFLLSCTEVLRLVWLAVCEPPCHRGSTVVGELGTGEKAVREVEARAEVKWVHSYAAQCWGHRKSRCRLHCLNCLSKIAELTRQRRSRVRAWLGKRKEGQVEKRANGFYRPPSAKYSLFAQFFHSIFRTVLLAIIRPPIIYQRSDESTVIGRRRYFVPAHAFERFNLYPILVNAPNFTTVPTPDNTRTVPAGPSP